MLYLSVIFKALIFKAASGINKVFAEVWVNEIALFAFFAVFVFAVAKICIETALLGASVLKLDSTNVSFSSQATWALSLHVVLG